VSIVRLDRSADEFRAEANACLERVARSQEESDTDGYLSQWANGVQSRLYRYAAELVDAGGKVVRAGLFTSDGTYLPRARYVKTRYGMAWRIDDPVSGRPIWFRPSHAQTGERKLATDREKGFTVGLVEATAYAAGLAGTSISPYPVAILDQEVTPTPVAPVDPQRYA
jgi:hypothetical protein